MAADLRHKSRTLLEGTDRAAARAMMKAVGFTDESLARPQIGIAHCWIGTMPCNWNHRQLAAYAAEGVRLPVGHRSRSTRSRSMMELPPVPKG